MKKNKEILTAIGLLIILVILLNPFDFYYSNMMLAGIITLFILLFVFFSIFAWRDKPADEREEIHQTNADSVAYLFGTAVLLVSVAIQSFFHNINIWSVVALTIMILARTIAVAYNERKN